jgi:hypothetical protein
MSAAMKLLYREHVETDVGSLLRSTYVCYGLTPSGANTVPFPSPGLMVTPRRVSLTPVGNGALGVAVTLDTSQGAADPTGELAGGKLGVDNTNLYVYIGAGTQFEVTVEHSPHGG